MNYQIIPGKRRLIMPFGAGTGIDAIDVCDRRFDRGDTRPADEPSDLFVVERLEQADRVADVECLDREPLGFDD